MGRILLCVLPLVACAAATATITTWPVEPPHLVRIGISAEALVQIESLATVTRTTRREQVACVAHFGALPVARGGWIIAIIALNHGQVPFKSDSLGVQWTGQLCPVGVPNIHSHIVHNDVWDRPSDFDTTETRRVRRAGDPAPFHVLISVGPKAPSLITIYGLR